MDQKEIDAEIARINEAEIKSHEAELILEASNNKHYKMITKHRRQELKIQCLNMALMNSKESRDTLSSEIVSVAKEFYNFVRT